MWNKKLKCELLGYTVDLVKHEVVLMLAPFNCCHQPGAIEFAKKRDPKVKSIKTVAGNVPDTSYRLVNKEWKPFLLQAVK